MPTGAASDAMSNKSHHGINSLGPKHRQAVLAHWQVEIVRSGVDQLALEQIRQRAIHDPEVRNDPQLAAQIERCISERSNDIKRLHGTRVAAQPIRGASVSRFGAFDPTLDEVRRIVDHLRLQGQEQIARNDEMALSFTLERLKSLQHEFPNAVDASALRPLADAHESLKQQRNAISHDIEMLARKAAEAAAVGDHDAAAAAMRQLSAYHITHPDLLSDEGIDAIRGRVMLAGAHRQHEEAAHELMRREREVRDELRALRDAIRNYRRAAHANPHDSTADRAAERAYRKAVREIRHLDREWLAGTILEIVGLLDDWEDHPKSADKQVEAFIRTLKSTLRELHADIRATDKQ